MADIMFPRNCRSFLGIYGLVQATLGGER